ncbi:TetR/AcrR family transcriptional regulator [Thermoleophilia bacterium SCSIO 60948]|nr:TetR/AcrR family transcriptional regulator [Thermoleophilia bacterium SCSIO 60948]
MGETGGEGGAAPRRRLGADARRAAIALAAGRAFAARGYAGARLDDIAAAAGVTKPIVYRHFGSKKGLYLALLRRHEADLPGFFSGLELPEGAGPRELIRAVLDPWIEYTRANSHTWEMLFRDSSGDEEIRRVRREVSARAIEVLAAFIGATSSMPTEQRVPAAVLLSQGLAATVIWWNDNPDVDRETIAAVAERYALSVVDDA